MASEQEHKKSKQDSSSILDSVKGVLLYRSLYEQRFENDGLHRLQQAPCGALGDDEEHPQTGHGQVLRLRDAFAQRGLEGLTVLDLGCGSGRDCYLASALVGEQGHVVGLDMTEEQLDVAKSCSAQYCKRCLVMHSAAYDLPTGLH